MEGGEGRVGEGDGKKELKEKILKTAFASEKGTKNQQKQENMGGVEDGKKRTKMCYACVSLPVIHVIISTTKAY